MLGINRGSRGWGLHDMEDRRNPITPSLMNSRGARLTHSRTLSRSPTIPVTHSLTHSLSVTYSPVHALACALNRLFASRSPILLT